MEIDRMLIIEKWDIQHYLESRGHTFVRKGSELYTACPLHKDTKPSFRVKGDVWFCDPCGCGGSIIDLVSKIENIKPIEAMNKLSGVEPTIFKPKTTSKPVNYYQYFSAVGEMVYEVVRYEPKDFRQRRPDGSGGFIYNMEGVTRILYNLPKVLKAEEVWIVEGEKDADNLNRLGFTATCNVGGAGKWMAGYTECLADKDIVLCPDNDEAGMKHCAIVRESIAGKVKTLRVLSLPKDFKDASDYIKHCKDDEDAKFQLHGIAVSVPILKKGIDLPIFDIAEMGKAYASFVKTSDLCSLDLSKWLPSLGKYLRPIVPGEMVTFVADTGIGKTAVLQNLSIKASPLPVLFFQMELPETLMFERYMQISSGRTGGDVFNSYKAGGKVDYNSQQLKHIFVCPLSKQDPESIEQMIIKSELKIGRPPAVVIVDYVGLVQGKGKGRYERMSDIAESMKRIAKSTNTIIVIASQIHRKEGEEVSLHDAKDSGSIENSSGLVFGVWRDSENADIMKVKILKSTKGGGGRVVDCNFHGESLRITENIKLNL